MPSIEKVKASDGTGNANLATVQNSRSSGASTIIVDTVLGINPTGFAGSMGTPHTFTDPITSEEITVISEETAVDFTGHVDGSNLEIDTIAPGYTDAGSEIGDIVIIKPTTQYADNNAAVLAVSHNDDGTLKDDIVTTDKILDSDVTKPKLEKPHYGCLYFTTNEGGVFGAAQVVPPYDDHDSVNGYGIVATTGVGSKLTIARDGLYKIQVSGTCIDVNATGFISWIVITSSTATTLRRSVTQQVLVGETVEQVCQMYLKAGDVVAQNWYNSGGNTRFGTVHNGGTASAEIRQMLTSLSVMEIR